MRSADAPDLVDSEPRQRIAQDRLREVGPCGRRDHDLRDPGDLGRYSRHDCGRGVARPPSGHVETDASEWLHDLREGHPRALDAETVARSPELCAMEVPDVLDRQLDRVLDRRRDIAPAAVPGERCEPQVGHRAGGSAAIMGARRIEQLILHPGVIDTEIHAASGDPDRALTMGPSLPMGRAGRPDEIANAIVWLMSDEASYLTASIVDVTGGR